MREPRRRRSGYVRTIAARTFPIGMAVMTSIGTPRTAAIGLHPGDHGSSASANSGSTRRQQPRRHSHAREEPETTSGSSAKLALGDAGSQGARAVRHLSMTPQANSMSAPAGVPGDAEHEPSPTRMRPGSSPVHRPQGHGGHARRREEDGCVTPLRQDCDGPSFFGGRSSRCPRAPDVPRPDPDPRGCRRDGDGAPDLGTHRPPVDAPRLVRARKPPPSATSPTPSKRAAPTARSSGSVRPFGRDQRARHFRTGRNLR